MSTYKITIGQAYVHVQNMLYFKINNLSFRDKVRFRKLLNDLRTRERWNSTLYKEYQAFTKVIGGK